MPKPPITISKKVTLQISPEQLWSFLADTDRVDRAVGIPPITFTPDPVKKGYNRAETSYWGIKLRYEEYPYDWIENRFYKILRRFIGGPIQEILTCIRLTPSHRGTELEVFADITPRNFLGVILTNVAIKQMATRNLIGIAKSFEEYANNPENEKVPILPKPEFINAVELELRLQKLNTLPVNKTLIGKLKELLLTGSDIETASIRPFDVACRWNANRDDVLQLCLYGARIGVLNLHWSVLCPNCRAVRSDTITLSQMKSECHCDTCEISFSADFASSVEVRFSAHPAVRLVRNETYCISGPANAPQFIAQLLLEPGEIRNEQITLKPGILRIHSYQIDGKETVHISSQDGKGKKLGINCKADALRISDKEILPGVVELEVTNSLSEEALLVIETETWNENAATAAMVTSLQDFRDLFPEEAVAPGEDIGISSIAVLFTDLSGSTALYREIGDSKAFSFVQNHFRFLTESVSKYHGGVVKTMGDAIMASFAKGLDALNAAIEMQRKWNEFCQQYGNYQTVKLKIGIHQGPAIATNNRGKLDCFGATVNTASRLEKLSHGQDVIISDEIYSDPAIQEIFKSQSNNISTETFEATLKGFDKQQFKLLRVKLIL